LACAPRAAQVATVANPTLAPPLGSNAARAQRIGLGVGLGLGLPFLLAAAFATWWFKFRGAAGGPPAAAEAAEAAAAADAAADAAPLAPTEQQMQTQT